MRYSSAIALSAVVALGVHCDSVQFPFKINWDQLGIPKQVKEFFGGHSPDGHKEPKDLPDKHVNFNKWIAEGIYAIRVSEPQTGGEEPSFDSEAPIEPQNLRMYGFYKIFDGSQKKFRIDAYPISSPEMTPEPLSKRTYQGPLLMFADGNDLYLVKERLSRCEESDPFGCNVASEDDVVCHKVEMEFERPNPLKHAQYRGLTFEHNTLCHRYENIALGESSKKKHKGSYMTEIRNSELYLDAFDHNPIELHVEGRLWKQPSHESYASKTYRRFLVHVFVHDFEYDVSAKEEREMLRWPETLRDICKESRMDELDEEDLMLVRAAGL